MHNFLIQDMHQTLYNDEINQKKMICNVYNNLQFIYIIYFL